MTAPKKPAARKTARRKPARKTQPKAEVRVGWAGRRGTVWNLSGRPFVLVSAEVVDGKFKLTFMEE